MVQHLFNTIKDMQDEVRRLRGRLDRISIGNTIIATNPGGTVPAAVDGAIIRGNADPNWERLAASVPAANVRNVLGLDNGDLRPSWKTALDATNPTTAAFGDAAAPGTSLVFSHRDHRHGMPAGGGGHTIEDEGSPLTARTKLNFVGAGVTVTDDSGDDATVVTIPGSGGGGPQTKYIPLTFQYDRRTGLIPVMASDAHGSLHALTMGYHFDNANNDASFKILGTHGVVVPADFVSGMKFVFAWSSSAASNNAVFGFLAQKWATGVTAGTSLLNNTTQTFAAPGVANTMTFSELAFTTDPVAGDTLGLEVWMNTNDAGDTNTGIKSLWGVWLVYTGDGGSDLTNADLQVSFLQNEIMNFPSLEKADGTQPEWWLEDHANCTGTEEDLAGESLTARYNLRCHKVVIATAGPHWFYQRHTYADQPRVKSGETVSLIYAVWSVAGVSARVGLLTSAATSSYSTPTTTAAWNIHTVDALVLDGTYVDVVEEVNAVGTAYFIPLAFMVGGKAYPIGPRNLVFRHKDNPTEVVDLTGASSMGAFADIDCTASTSNLCAKVLLNTMLFESTAGNDWQLYFRRNGSSEAGGLTNRYAQVFGDISELQFNQLQIIVDAGQIVEYQLFRGAGATTLDEGTIAVAGYWEWE